MSTEESRSAWFGGWRGVGYPALLLGSVTLAWVGMRGGWGVESSAWLGILSGGVVLGALEWWRPYRESWKPSGKVLRLDLVHNAVSSILLAPLVKAGLAALVLWLYGVLRSPAGGGLWPHHWPVGLQLLLMVPLADFGVYWAHRWMHATDKGWRIHAVHHSPVALNFWAAARTHPFNVVVALGAELSILMLLGVGQQVFTLWLVYKSVNGLLQHSNVDFRPGFLSYVLATNEAHRIHHSEKMEHSHSNYGNTTMVWDQLFGTYSKPGLVVAEVGIEGTDIPEDYWSHLVAPFALESFETGPATEVQEVPKELANSGPVLVEEEAMV